MTDTLYVSRNEGGRGLTSKENSQMQQFEDSKDYIKKDRESLIIEDSKSSEHIRRNRITVGYHLPFQHNELGHLPYVAVALIPRVPVQISLALIWSSVFRHLEPSFGLRGPSPRLLLPSGRLGLSPGAWGTPNKGNADGAVGIFGKCRARVGYGPAPGST